MKYVVLIFAAAILVFAAGMLFLLADNEGLAEAPSASPAANTSQVVRQQSLTPTLTMEDQPLRAGVVFRDAELTPETTEAAGDLGEASGSAVIREEGDFPAFLFSQQPDLTLATLTLAEGSEEEGEPCFQGTLEELAEYLPTQDGVYTLDIWAGWKGNGDESSFSGVAGYRAELTWQLPRQPIQLTVDSTELQQGYTVVLRASNLPEGTTEVTAETDMGFTPTFYAYGGEMIALMPAKYNGAIGEYHITLHAGEESQSFTMTVTDGKFDVTVQQFNVDQSVADSTVNNDEANYVYEITTRPLKNMGDPEKYWEGPFVLPIDPVFKAPTSTFGRIRVINGSSSQHAGIDYPAPLGTQVWAPNNGRVLFAGFLQLTGNTICIEHGFGLKSWFYHLNEVEVEAGQMVKTGDPIGKVGTTGFSTGPHLHFTMSVNNIYTNPEQYLEIDPLAAE